MAVLEGERDISRYAALGVGKEAMLYVLCGSGARVALSIGSAYGLDNQAIEV
jgi:hypothetical protein